MPVSLPLLFGLLLSSAQGTPWPREVAAPVERYIDANARWDAQALSEGFHPAALMYWLDEHGEVAGRTQSEWRTRIATTSKPAFEQSIATVDRRGDAAVVTVDGKRDGKPLTDYLLVMKLGERWRIVGKVFAMSERPTQPNPQAVAAIRAVVEAKLRSDASFNGADLLATQHPRSVFFNLDLGELVAVSAHEWAARFDQRRREGSPLKPLSHEIGPIFAVGDVGYARWTVRWSSGNTITDYALLVREHNRWRMINVAWVPDAKE